MEPTAATTTPPKQAALWEDFIDIFYAPRQVYGRRSAGRFGLVLLFLTLMMTALFFASRGPLATAMEAEMTRSIASTPQAGQITSEQMEQMRSMSGIFGTIGIAVFFPLGVILAGFAAWVMAKLFDSAATLAMCITIVTYAQFPRILGSMAGLGQALVNEPETLNQIAMGPSRFPDANTTSPLLLGILGRFDLFILWSAVLIAIGLQVIARLPSGRAYLVAAIVWMLGVAPVLLGELAR